MRPKIYITRKIDDSILSKLEAICDVDMWPHKEQPIPRHVLEDKITDVDGLFCLLTESIDQSLLTKAKNLKVISTLAVGYNHIDIDEARRRGITVTHTPDVLTETTADLTFGLLMATARRLVEANHYLKNDEWVTWSPMQLTGQDIHGATIGIIGMGRIGEAVAKRAQGFNMDVLYHNRNKLSSDKENLLHTRYVNFETLLQQSDFVCIMVPLTDETKNLITAKEIKMMKPNAIIINTARGGIIDEADLYDCLVRGDIWGAGLDVFENEPITSDHPLNNLPNVVTTPHIGSASIQTRLKMGDVAAENLIRVLNNQDPIYKVV